MKVEERSGYVQAKGDLQNLDLKDDIRIKVIKSLHSQSSRSISITIGSISPYTKVIKQ